MDKLDLSPGVFNKNAPEITWLLCTNVVNNNLKISIESCLSQTFKNFEILVIANGLNAENIASTIRSWYGDNSKIRIFSTPILYLNFSLSLGAHLACGRFIARMDADDVAYPDRLQKQFNFLMKHPDISILGTAYHLIDQNGAVQSTITPPQKNEDIKSALIFRNPICHPSVMIKKSILLDSGGYLGGLYAEDYDLWVRLSLDSDIHFENLQEICIGYRIFGAEARGSIASYRSVSSTQWMAFISTGNIKWLISSLLSSAKAIFLGK